MFRYTFHMRDLPKSRPHFASLLIRIGLGGAKFVFLYATLNRTVQLDPGCFHSLPQHSNKWSVNQPLQQVLRNEVIFKKFTNSTDQRRYHRYFVCLWDNSSMESISKFSFKWGLQLRIRESTGCVSDQVVTTNVEEAHMGSIPSIITLEDRRFIGWLVSERQHTVTMKDKSSIKLFSTYCSCFPFS